ncbi:P-loop NTPase fold protein [Massilistercora timonensis]|uniref:KAP family P-loop NTPase fold protein n=1 Tax=Massilistercora timonensis TaxID=2086584 RepID=UPI003208D0F2
MKKYKKYNLDATDENIIEAIKNNDYARADAIKDFIESLELIDTNMFISLDARWGEGKTFYIRQIEFTLKYLSKKILGQDVSELEPIFSNSKLKSIELDNTYFPIYYNAWLYDCHKDPLMSLLYVLVKECGKYVSTVVDNANLGEKLLSILSPFSLSLPFLPSLQISGDFEKIKENLKGKDILEEIKTAEEVRDTVKLILNDIITEEAQKLVIFIDELDRCRPTFAIETLERLKHYFDDERIIFVVSVNKEQLIHTISKFYGDSFDSTAYLNKFFDMNIYLPEIPNYLKRNNILQINQEQYYLKKIVDELGEYYNLSLRDTIIFHQNVEATSKRYYNDYFAQGRILSGFVPIILVLDRVSQIKKSEFMEGKGSTFKELCENIPSLRKMICCFGGDGIENEENYQKGYEKIYYAYECTFGKNKIYDGEVDIPRDLKEICIRVCNGN